MPDYRKEDIVEVRPIAYIHTDFPTKFGIPRQGNLVKGLFGKIIFEPEFSDASILRGIEEFSHLWLLWGFSANKKEHFSATVRPPRLGGNERLGVFATRSPFRPNPIGLTVVELDHVERSKKDGLSLLVWGADLMDKTPIYDIKPYLPHIDSIPEASGGFAAETSSYRLLVECRETLLLRLPLDKREPLMEILAQDPRPAYHNAPERIYGFLFAGFEIKFRVEEGVLFVVSIEVDK